MKKMKAIICTKYGPPEVLKLVEVEKPLPKDNEVRIKIHATTAHIGDTKIRGLQPGMGAAKDFFFKPMMRLMLGFKRPRRPILGMDLAGEIETTGKGVTRWKTGDLVFASAYEGHKFGAYAEYICLSENGLIAAKPHNMTYEEAAPLANGALTALLTLRKAKLQKGQKVLIYGASGSMGTYALQLAKYHETTVHGVCSTANMDMVKKLGADRVFDYTRENFNDVGEVYDVIFDTVAKLPKAEQKRSLKPGGLFLDGLSSTGGMKLKTEDLNLLKTLCEERHLRTAIDRIYKLSEMVEAHRYVDEGHKKGNVAITVNS